MAKEQRFERVYTQGALQITEIWVDKETGVNDLFHADERWEALRLTELFGGVLPEFDYFGVTPVSRGQWERIAARSRDEADWRAVIDEAAPWAEASFARHGVISILGL